MSPGDAVLSLLLALLLWVAGTDAFDSVRLGVPPAREPEIPLESPIRPAFR